MNYRIRYLPETLKDKAEIKQYLSQYYASTVKKFFALLKKRIAQVKQFPYSSPVYEDDADYRRLVVGDYLVFYMIDEANKIVEIHRIFHGLKDIRSQINKE